LWAGAGACEQGEGVEGYRGAAGFGCLLAYRFYQRGRRHRDREDEDEQQRGQEYDVHVAAA
jgi:hypothetical protein